MERSIKKRQWKGNIGKVRKRFSYHVLTFIIDFFTSFNLLQLQFSFVKSVGKDKYFNVKATRSLFLQIQIHCSCCVMKEKFIYFVVVRKFLIFPCPPFPKFPINFIFNPFPQKLSPSPLNTIIFCIIYTPVDSLSLLIS